MKMSKRIRNRRFTALCLCLGLLFSLAGCTFAGTEGPDSGEVLISDTETAPEEISVPIETETEPEPEESETEKETDVVPEDPDAEEAAALAALLRENLPRMDGSTSAIPLEAAIRSGIFGISREEAQKDVRHSTSHDSYYHLLDGECALAFSHLLSPEQYQAAEERGIAVEMTPIAREGFVFLVSAQNPVESLTADEVKRIYTGEISNWSEVGGADMPITAYQRNIDSGSQNYMRAFMGDLPLSDAPTELRPGNMDTLVDCVAAFDGEKNGIGYSVFSYVGGMYDAAGGVKLLKIDGVEPTYETICDGSYPCTGYNYAVIRADEAEDSPARNLLAWALSSAGQRSIAETGYYAPLLPTSGIGVSIPDLHLMTAVGTGKEDCTPADWCYSVALPGRPYESGYPDGKRIVPIEGTENSNVFDYTGNVMLPETGNAALDAEITAFAAASFAELEEVCLRAEPFGGYGSQFVFSKEQMFRPYSEFVCVNGYLSVRVGIHSFGLIYITPELSAVWDMESGKRLALSDLFCKDAAFVPMLNSAVRRYADAELLFDETARSITAFEGLTADFDNFGIAFGWNYEIPIDGNSLYLFLGFHPENNPYFKNDVIVPVSVWGNELCLLSEPRSLGGVYGEETKILWTYPLGTQCRTEIPMTGGEYGDPYSYGGEYRWTEFEGCPGAETINEAQRAYREKHADVGAEIWTDEFVHRVGVEIADMLKWNSNLENPTAEQLGTAWVLVEETALPLGSRYAAVTYQVRVQHLDWIGYGGGVYIDRRCVIYDLLNGEEVPLSEVFSGLDNGVWLTAPPAELPDGGLPDSGLFDSLAEIGADYVSGRLLLTFEPAPGERYILEVRHDALRFLADADTEQNG